jgi:hypothetical protein
MNQMNGEAAFGSMNRGPKEVLLPRCAESNIETAGARAVPAWRLV